MANRVLLLRASNGLDIDISLGALPFEEDCVTRATPFAFDQAVELVTCSAEDLIVLKAFADRGQDWRDVEGVIVRQGQSLDWDYVEGALTPLCELKEAPEIPERLRQLKRSLEVE